MSSKFKVVGLAVLLGTLAVTVSASVTPFSVRSGKYRGAKAIERDLQARIVDQRHFSLSDFLGSSDLRKLLGTYDRVGGVSEFVNGEPNSLNLVVYYSVFSQISEEVAKRCTENTGRNLKLRKSFEKVLMEVCQWPKPESKTDVVLKKYWQHFMGFGVPETEFQIWKKFALSEFGALDHKEAISQFTRAILMHPYFLLDR